MPSRLDPPLAEELDARRNAAGAAARSRRVEYSTKWYGLSGALDRLVGPRRRDDVDAVVAEHARDVAEVRLAVRDVLDRLERADDVEAAIVELGREQVLDAGTPRSAARSASARTRSPPRDVHADDLACRVGEQRACRSRPRTRRRAHASPRSTAGRTGSASRGWRRSRRGLVRDDTFGVRHGRNVSWPVVDRDPASALASCRRRPASRHRRALRVRLELGARSDADRWPCAMDRAARAGRGGRAPAIAHGPRLRSVPLAWLVAAAFVVVAVESALWSVDPRLTVCSRLHGRRPLRRRRRSRSRLAGRAGRGGAGAARRPRRDRSRRAREPRRARGVARRRGAVRDDRCRLAVPRPRTEPEHRADAAVDRHAARRLALAPRPARAALGRRSPSSCSSPARSASPARAAQSLRASVGADRDGACTRTFGGGEARRCGAACVRSRSSASRSPGSRTRHPSQTTPRRGTRLRRRAGSTRSTCQARGRDRTSRARGAYLPPVEADVVRRERAGRRPGTALCTRETSGRLPAYGFGTEDDRVRRPLLLLRGRFVENAYLGLFLQLGAAGAGPARSRCWRALAGVRSCSSGAFRAAESDRRQARSASSARRSSSAARSRASCRSATSRRRASGSAS